MDYSGFHCLSLYIGSPNFPGMPSGCGFQTTDYFTQYATWSVMVLLVGLTLGIPVAAYIVRTLLQLFGRG